MGGQLTGISCFFTFAQSSKELSPFHYSIRPGLELQWIVGNLRLPTPSPRPPSPKNITGALLKGIFYFYFKHDGPRNFVAVVPRKKHHHSDPPKTPFLTQLRTALVMLLCFCLRLYFTDLVGASCPRLLRGSESCSFVHSYLQTLNVWTNVLTSWVV